MKLLEKILIPIDDEINSGPQLKIAMELVKKYNSELIIVKVLPSDAKLETVNDLIVDHINDKLQKIIKKLDGSNIKSEAHILYGNQFDQIVSMAEQKDVNLILLNDKVTEEDGSSLDIITEKLIRKSGKPVWVIKKGFDKVPERVLCPVDYSDASARALTNAIKIAKTFQAQLRIINVFTPLLESFSVRLNIDYDKENKQLKIENAKNLKSSSVNLIYLTWIIKRKP